MSKELLDIYIKQLNKLLDKWTTLSSHEQRMPLLYEITELTKKIENISDWEIGEGC